MHDMGIVLSALPFAVPTVAPEVPLTSGPFKGLLCLKLSSFVLIYLVLCHTYLPVVLMLMLPSTGSTVLS